MNQVDGLGSGWRPELERWWRKNVETASSELMRTIAQWRGRISYTSHNLTV